MLADGVRSVRAIKTILLDQTKVAGLGNIYADEALYRAGIHPLKPGACLSDSEIEALHSSIVAVLKEAIANHGTTIRDYRTGSGDTGSFQNKLEVYRRTGKPCGNCGTLIEKIKVGAGAHTSARTVKGGIQVVWIDRIDCHRKKHCGPDAKTMRRFYY